MAALVAALVVGIGLVEVGVVVGSVNGTIGNVVVVVVVVAAVVVVAVVVVMGVSEDNMMVSSSLSE